MTAAMTTAMRRGWPFPDDRHYDPQRMLWARIAPAGAGDGVLDGCAPATPCIELGLSALACATGGDILVFAARPLGAWLDVDRAFGNVETAKTVSSVRTPVAGRLVAFNPRAESDGERIQQSPYDCWLVRIAPADPQDATPAALALAGLLTGAAALAALDAQLARYGIGAPDPDHGPATGIGG